MSRTNNLLDLCLSGKGASYLIEALLDELPTQDEIRISILSTVPGASVRFDESVCFVSHTDKSTLVCALPYFEQSYPELDFVIEAVSVIEGPPIRPST